MNERLIQSNGPRSDLTGFGAVREQHEPGSGQRHQGRR